MSAANYHRHQDPESEFAASETTTLLPTTDSPEQHNPENTPKMSASTLFWRVGALYGAAAVGLGAFGAHGLKKRISDPNKIASWSTAAHYQLVHSAVLLVASHHPVASALFTAGMTMFSGSIYALTLDTERFRFLGPVTPVGGLFLIAGWLALAFASKGTAVARFPRF
ncbi:hypothetical protein QBC45DRAFT_331171 [Copromyces sp. CBS 386.78]|nr:hypothetical protein QBC45DRAFT_331171 [Copromyces sp. CBS 386.78]